MLANVVVVGLVYVVPDPAKHAPLRLEPGYMMPTRTRSMIHRTHPQHIHAHLIAGLRLEHIHNPPIRITRPSPRGNVHTSHRHDALLTLGVLVGFTLIAYIILQGSDPGYVFEKGEAPGGLAAYA